VAHRDELVEQAVQTLEGFGLGSLCTVRSIQTLQARGEFPPAGLVVLDEARHYLSPTWNEFPKAYPKAVLLGADATPSRADGSGMGALFDCLVTGLPIKEAIKQGYLVPCIAIAPKKPLPSGQIAQRPVDAYLQHARGRRAVCFAGSIAACEQFVQEFRAAGLRADMVTGELAESKRRDVIARQKAGELDVLVNQQVLVDGWDSPATDCVMLARRTSTPDVYLQIVGRGLRPSPATGKKDCLLLDLTGMVHIHGLPDEDRVYSLDGRGIRLAREVVERFCQVCGVILAPTDSVCPDCGREPPEQKPPKVTGEKVERFVYRPRASDEERLRKLSGWIATARAKGYKPNWPYVRHNIEFGRFPTKQEIARAQKR
jgi:superfamily II DNA or RNA helicase